MRDYKLVKDEIHNIVILLPRLIQDLKDLDEIQKTLFESNFKKKYNQDSSIVIQCAIKSKEVLENLEKDFDSLSEIEKIALAYNDHLFKYHTYVRGLIENLKTISKDKEPAHKTGVPAIQLVNTAYRIIKEINEKIILNMDALDREFLIRFAVYCEQDFKSKFEKHYPESERKFINKIHQDSRLTGFPTNIINCILKVMNENYDCKVCILRGGFAAIKLFEMLGDERPTYYLGIGRTSITNWDIGTLYADPKLNEIKGKNVLIVEDDVMSGTTAKNFGKEVNKYRPKSIQLFVSNFNEKSNRKDAIEKELKESFFQKIWNAHNIAKLEEEVSRLKAVENKDFQMTELKERLLLIVRERTPQLNHINF